MLSYLRTEYKGHDYAHDLPPAQQWLQISLSRFLREGNRIGRPSGLPLIVRNDFGYIFALGEYRVDDDRRAGLIDGIQYNVIPEDVLPYTFIRSGTGGIKLVLIRQERQIL